MLLRVYVTDALQLVTKNTAAFAGGNYIRARYLDMARAPARAGTPEPEQDPEKVIDRILGKLKGG